MRLPRFRRLRIGYRYYRVRRSRTLRLLAVAGLALVFSASNALASPTLKLNSKGHDVLLLQQKLKLIGYDISDLDGVFGEETKKAVTKFQRDQQLSDTGVVNNATWRALKGIKETLWDKNAALPATDKSALQALKQQRLREREPAPAIIKPDVPYGKQILASSKVKDVIATAKKYMGVPYAFGGTTPKGFDCSGFLQFVFAKHGLNIPRLADEQYRLGTSSRTAQNLVPGDLVFFTTYTAGPSHCGIYLGKNEFIHTSSSKGVRIDSLTNDYWKPRFIGGRHIVK